MIKTEIISDNALRIIAPEKLKADDFSQIAPQIDALITKCPSEEFLIPLNHLDWMEPILIRGGAYIVDGQEPGEVRPRSLEISERPD
jgi:hypothetical protein